MTFRSLEMSRFQMIVPRNSAYQTVNILGQENLLHIVDNGNLLDRPFSQMVKRCDEGLQKIGILIDALRKKQVQFDEYDETQSLFVEKMHEIWKQQSKNLELDQSKLIDAYEERLLEEYQRYCDLSSRIEKMNQSKGTILEKIACLQTIRQFFGETEAKRQSQDYYLNNAVEGSQMKGVSFMVGVVEKSSELRLSRMIYRVSRGYACTKTMEDFKFFGLRDFNEQVILVIYPSSDSSVLEKKLKKVMDTFCRSNFILAELDSPQQQHLKFQQATNQYHQTVNLLQLAEKQMKSFMHEVKNLECIEKWRIFFWKERTLYETLNKMDSRDQFFIANIFVPNKFVKELSLKISRISPSPTLHEVSLGKGPTAFDSNSYTSTAQEITNTYGIPRYQEVNPSIFTTVTFPFFFGVMFGDIGHGLILFCIGLYLVFNDDKIKKSKLKMFSQLRYMIIMMGFFAVYCGFIYNDVIGFNVNIFGSCYDPPPHPSEEDEKMSISLHPTSENCVYPLGIDPIWGRSENNLVFVNSLKMKLSVIIAIIHMTLGVCCKAANALFFKKKLDFYFEFIPQFIFLFGLFGYMDFLIIFKWLKPWQEIDVEDIPPQQWAPSIITTMMNLGLKMGATSTDHDGSSNMWGETGNSSQDTIQLLLLLVGVLCVPIMLFPKPIIEIRRMNQAKRSSPLENAHELDQDNGLKQKLNPVEHNSEEEQGHQDSSEIFVHQLIETIQFALGAVSNTASYLRLWALSLAHSQLSQVFWNKTAGTFAGQTQLLQLTMYFVGFWMVCWITFGLIICMDSMECFLHSLRLHWVEFQNKFYKGDGFAYSPLYFKKVIIGNKTVSLL